MISTSMRGRKDVAEFVPINPEGLSDRELLEAAVHGINKTHDCVHQLRASTTSGFKEVADTVKGINEELGGLKTDRDLTNGRIEKLAKMFGAESWQPGEQKVKPKGIGSWSGAKAGILSLIVIVAALVAHASTYDFVREMAISADGYLHKAAQQQAGQGNEVKRK